MASFTLKHLPLEKDLETKQVLKKAASAHRYLAELKGMVDTIPNESILISTLTLQEAKDSSEIENIITTHDELYKSELFVNLIQSPAAKEVGNYATALQKGFALVRETRLLTVNHILEIHKELERNNAGIRKLPGTELKNQQTGATVYTPPQEHQEIVRLMSNLEKFINDDTISDLDPLVKMA
ncbi:MAG: Fic family protein, partial [Candidatus Electrothrix sp. AR1]|nr:Fic family protein [Candidatus Electrothrix sp. AR1]